MTTATLTEQEQLHLVVLAKAKKIVQEVPLQYIIEELQRRDVTIEELQKIMER